MRVLDDIMKAEKIGRGWSGRDVVAFHYFNPNGLVAKKRAGDDKISKLHDAGKCRGGALIAYGSFDDFYVKRISELVGKRRIGRVELLVAVEGLKKNIERQAKFIAEVEAGPGVAA